MLLFVSSTAFSQQAYYKYNDVDSLDSDFSINIDSPNDIVIENNGFWAGFCEYQIYDNLGRMVASGISEPNHFNTLNLKNNGIYLIRTVSNKGNVSSKKFIYSNY